MQLAINYSPQAAELLAAGRIRLDRFKCPDWPDMIAQASSLRPVYVHFPLEAGPAAPQRPIDLDQVQRLIDQTGTPYVNTHLVAYADDGQSDAQVVDQMRRDVSALVERFGADRVIAENIPYHAGPRAPKRYAPACVDPQAIARVIDETGCGLLLDISHGRISAASLGVDARGYLAGLPVRRLRELHVTGLRAIDGVLVDHLGLGEDDWPYVDWAMQQIASGAWSRPWCAAFEYGGTGEPFAWRSESSVIASDLPRLDELFGRRLRGQRGST